VFATFGYAKVINRMNTETKVAVVTGGSSGIGAAVVSRLADSGVLVYSLDRTESTTEVIADVRPMTLDVSAAEQVQETVQHIAGRHRTIDYLVNSAGVLRWGGVTDTSVDDWDLVMSVNLKGAWLLCREVAAVMKENGGGSIVNVGSNMAVRGVANQIAYSASKGGLVALTRSAAVDLGRFGIRVNCVNPGHISTPMGDSAAELLGLSEDVVKARYPLQRIGQPDEVAGVVVGLLSDQSSFMTGAIVAVDGGYTA
jgi:NAD(P)-dependent dehydrogenase (short-subunit alcohol dehydrogenase family)